jgi:hypothetical protein
VVMDAVSHLLTSTCYQQMLSLMLAVNYFVMLMLSVKCCQILAAKTHNIFFALSSVHGCWHTYVDKRMPSLTAYLQSFLFVYTHKRRTWVLR